MIYRKFSKRQILAMTWWNRPGFEDRDGLICHGAVRSGKTLAITDGFFLWSMTKFRNETFGICGKTIGSLRRNVLSEVLPKLGRMGACEVLPCADDDGLYRQKRALV